MSGYHDMESLSYPRRYSRSFSQERFPPSQPDQFYRGDHPTQFPSSEPPRHSHHPSRKPQRSQNHHESEYDAQEPIERHRQTHSLRSPDGRAKYTQSRRASIYEDDDNSNYSTDRHDDRHPDRSYDRSYNDTYGKNSKSFDRGPPPYHVEIPRQRSENSKSSKGNSNTPIGPNVRSRTSTARGKVERRPVGVMIEEFSDSELPKVETQRLLNYYKDSESQELGNHSTASGQNHFGSRTESNPSHQDSSHLRKDEAHTSGKLSRKQKNLVDRYVTALACKQDEQPCCGWKPQEADAWLNSLEGQRAKELEKMEYEMMMQNDSGFREQEEKCNEQQHEWRENKKRQDEWDRKEMQYWEPGRHQYEGHERDPHDAYSSRPPSNMPREGRARGRW